MIVSSNKFRNSVLKENHKSFEHDKITLLELKTIALDQEMLRTKTKVLRKLVLNCVIREVEIEGKQMDMGRVDTKSLTCLIEKTAQLPNDFESRYRNIFSVVHSGKHYSIQSLKPWQGNTVLELTLVENKNNPLVDELQ